MITNVKIRVKATLVIKKRNQALSESPDAVYIERGRAGSIICSFVMWLTILFRKENSYCQRIDSAEAQVQRIDVSAIRLDCWTRYRQGWLLWRVVNFQPLTCISEIAFVQDKGLQRAHRKRSRVQPALHSLWRRVRTRHVSFPILQ